MDIYRQKLLDHYNDPRNYGRLLDANAIIKLENLSCGDEIELYFKTDGKKITNISFEGEGCAVSIAAASVLTEKVKGMELNTANALKLEDLMGFMGVQLTPSRFKCASLSLEALKNAVAKVKK